MKERQREANSLTERPTSILISREVQLSDSYRRYEDEKCVCWSISLFQTEISILFRISVEGDYKLRHV